MKRERISFSNNEGDKISAILEKPLDMHPHTYAIFAHCFTCNKNLNAVRNISRSLTSKGIAVLRFDFTGLGESEGAFEETNFTSNIQDLILASVFLEKNYKAPELLIGHSLGGAAVIYGARSIPSVKAIATIGAPADPMHVTYLMGEKGLEKIKYEGEAEVSIGGRPFTIKKQFLDDLENTSMEQVLRELKKPLLVMHSPFDKIVGIDNASEIFQGAFHPKSFVSLDDADHLLSTKEASLYAGETISAWAVKYLNIPENDPLKTDKQVVARISSDELTTDVKAGNFPLTADEPENLGGNDFGPTPYELLTSSLGACTAMTLKIYAERKGWNLEEAVVHLEHGKNYMEDCRQCENEKGNKIDHFKRVIELKGDLTEDQKKKLLEIAGKCPVHKTLKSEVQINTKLKE